MRVIILGGDGYIGWPLALSLSKKGHSVMIVDNCMRREVDLELNVESLTPIRTIEERINSWENITKIRLQYENINVAEEYLKIKNLFSEFRPDAIFHLAEFKSAPYSMRSAEHKIKTIGHNVNAANNILSAIIESNCNSHLIHIGTMGVYGYNSQKNTFIPEGYIDVDMHYDNNFLEKKNILYPFNPGSIYHLSKSLDNLIFQFYNKNDKIKITDLHQGIVWGSQTTETSMHDDLINRFDYDGDYGTVLNRFIIEAAINYPLTIHGTGEQTRAFIHLSDSIKCLELAMSNPPNPNERVRIFNQLSETKSVISLAKNIERITNCKIDFLDNPRNEAKKNELEAKNDSLIKLGFEPKLLNDEMLEDLLNFAKIYSNRCNIDKIPSRPKWN
tara:strand:+ start:8529 stop:9692 length:1164 start_codon:yes stop_codon:yes gene_type:complete